ncbi:hypothetical protein B0T18DRAFT_4417 [Schizothecium vesticola]|uniref:DUF6594 domain-containing protein n=1 Tax=Schizothecium vesticola TaxID=314040 RepID=A0AA40F829_9PEZI|nr:hypothetical protein B0T18DRAFT_4417 [Schizothecium vesticola]
MAAATLFGYDAVATCMNYHRDLAQHRRFGVLNARNLLYLQSELISLETRLAELDAQANDFTRGNDVWSMPRSWHALERGQNSEHLEIVLKIRDRLDIYNRALQYQAWLLSQKRPDTRPMRNLAAFLSTNPTNMATRDAEFVAPKHQDDLIAISTAEKEPMVRALERRFYWLFGFNGSELAGDNGGMTRYSDGKLQNFVRICAVVVSSLLPILYVGFGGSDIVFAPPGNFTS